MGPNSRGFCVCLSVHIFFFLSRLSPFLSSRSSSPSHLLNQLALKILAKSEGIDFTATGFDLLLPLISSISSWFSISEGSDFNGYVHQFSEEDKDDDSTLSQLKSLNNLLIELIHLPQPISLIDPSASTFLSWSPETIVTGNNCRFPHQRVSCLVSNLRATGFKSIPALKTHQERERRFLL